MTITKTSSKRAWIGAVLAAAVLLVCIRWYDWKAGAGFAALFLAAGFLNVRIKHPAFRFGIHGAWGVICIFLSGWIACRMVTEQSYFSIGHYRVVMNMLCTAIIYGAALALTGSIRSAVIAASSALLLLSTANSFVFQFRGTELKFMDIFSVGTAMNVVDQYRFTIQEGMAYGWILWSWMLFCFGIFPEPDDWFPRKWLHLAALIATCLCVSIFLYGSRDIRTQTWSNEGTTKNGYLLNFAVGIRDSFVSAPEGYSPGAVEELEEIYSGDAPETSPSLPNILIIMNESYVDFSVLGADVRTNQPVTPFVDSLTENTIKGYALTSTFGGGTAKVEYELLTGNNMAFLPDGSMPYEQYITADSFSLARVLEAQGYTTLATHPWLASGWNRTKVYPFFGFGEMEFLEGYPQQELVREYVSDREMYEHLLSLLDAQAEGPLFLFGITMQNHGDYIYDGENYQQTIFLEDYAMAHPMAEQYLTLLHESDRAVEYLLTELERYPEDTVVLFFGDHFPQVEGDFFQEVHGGTFDTLDQQMLQYTVPFFIWANYDIPEQTVACTAISYLGRYLLETAGVELPAYYRFLAEAESVIPAINNMGYYSPAAGSYLPLDSAEGEEALWLNHYAMLQYNSMFDSKNKSDLFFGQYLTRE